MNELKSFIKRNPSLVCLIRCVFRQKAHLQKLVSLLLRPYSTHRYLARHSCRKLQIGAGPNCLPGWLNTDVYVSSLDLIFLDATDRLPFRDCQFDYIFSEHVIEHITYEYGSSLLKECFRILKPNGVVRVATPDIKMLIDLFGETIDAKKRDYVAWFIDRNLPGLKKYRPIFVLNHFVQSWGHAFIYDRETLAESFSEAGFVDLQWCPPGDSLHGTLRCLERHGSAIGSDTWNNFETIVLEGRRP
jgi:predicted SAM-dependent methyltransferase